MRIISYFLLLFFAALSRADLASMLPVPPDPISALKLPTGFQATIFARLESGGSSYFRGPRMMAFSPQGDLYLSLGLDNKVVKLPDANHDGVADKVIIVAEQLNGPHGLAFVGDMLYVANQDGVVKLEDGRAMPVIFDLPSGGHTKKTLKLGPDGYLYLNVGSSCNVCVENEPLRATMLRYTVEGKPAGALQTLGRHAPSSIWATGLRNTQGFAWHPKTGELFATNNGADMRSGNKNGVVNDDLPPEHLNQIQAGGFYGWPHCWGDKFVDPNFAGDCSSMQSPAITLPAHSTPIGIAFLDKTTFPVEYRSDALVALHGSWNRNQPSGYKVVRVHFEQDKPVKVSDFITGWLSNKGAWGRPVDVAVAPDGAVYISDDRAGLVYRIIYKGESN
ncbi:MAG: PQQ-dependent sugar dehydrogenase [Methylophilales bacterium]|nr:PQQ-dependent sugar dehydrogenase [Methylophilales bacterium]